MHVEFHFEGDIPECAVNAISSVGALLAVMCSARWDMI